MNRAIGIRILVFAISIAVFAAIVAAIVVMGPPSQQRQRRLDERRVQDLSTIVNTISKYTSTHEALPADLSVLGKQPGPRRAPTDPETGAPYEYIVLNAESYQLCAVFATPSADENAAAPYLQREGWTHGTGRQCFERNQKIGKNQ
jgi:type II secretory pathway pseudopilin PulG